MDPGIWASIIAVGASGVAGTFQWLRARKRQQVTDRESAEIRAQTGHASAAVIDAARYDNLQEDLKEERNARKQETNDLRADVQRLSGLIAVLGADIRIRDDYIMKLRQHIANGESPPPPEWPISLTKSIR